MPGTPTLDTQLTRLTFPRSELTALHVSGPLFGGAGNRLRRDALFGQLQRDVAILADEASLRPDLLIVTGDLASAGLPGEYVEGVAFLTTLVKATGISRRHVVLVPGSHDVNRLACHSYFLRQQSAQQEPEPPYSPKWEQFAKAFNEFYAGSGIEFSLEEPWTLFDMPQLGITVAGLNSTMAESHLDDYGSLTEEQLRWFTAPLAERQRQGLLRLAAVHRTDVRDALSLDRILGEPGLVNLLISGQPDGTRNLRSGLPVLATGSIGSAGRYQLITMRQHGFARYTRLHEDEGGWRPEWDDYTHYPIEDAPVVFQGSLAPGPDAQRSPAPALSLSPGGAAPAPGGHTTYIFHGHTTFAQQGDAYNAGNDIRQTASASDNTDTRDSPPPGGQP